MQEYVKTGVFGRISEAESEQLASTLQTLRHQILPHKFLELVKCAQVMVPNRVTCSQDTFEYLGDIKSLTRLTNYVLRSSRQQIAKSVD